MLKKEHYSDKILSCWTCFYTFVGVWWRIIKYI